MNIIRGFRKFENGQGLMEYGLILALVSIVMVGVLGSVGGKVSDTFDAVADSNGIYSEDDIDAKVAEGYIPIANAEDLDSIRNTSSRVFGDGTKWEDEYTSNLQGEKFILVSDIDLGGFGTFIPIGDSSKPFKGSFDGGGYVIQGLTVEQNGSYAGLFGYAQGATLSNIGVIDVSVKGKYFTGGLVGRQEGSSVVNSYTSGDIEGGRHTGGLVGFQVDRSSVENSYSTVNVFGNDGQTGGLVGYQYDYSSIADSYSTGDVEGEGDRTGGLVGYQSLYSSVSKSYATGDVNSTGDDVGGLVGYHSTISSTIDSYSSGSVTGSGVNVGGFVGWLRSGSVRNSSWANDVGGVGASAGFGLNNGVFINNQGRKKSEIESLINGLGLYE